MHILSLSGRKKGTWPRLIFLIIRLGLSLQNELYVERQQLLYHAENTIDYLRTFLPFFFLASPAAQLISL